MCHVFSLQDELTCELKDCSDNYDRLDCSEHCGIIKNNSGLSIRLMFSKIDKINFPFILNPMSKTSDSENKISDLSYDDAINMLEEIVSNLEDGQVELDSLVEQYKQGVGLLKHCRSKVKSAEIQIREANLEMNPDTSA